MGYADATGALAELADLDELTELSLQDYPGASLADIDEDAWSSAHWGDPPPINSPRCGASSGSCRTRRLPATDEQGACS